MEETTSESPKTKTDLVREFVRNKIKTRSLSSAARLPTENDLVHQLSVSRTTVRRALDQLSSEGLIERRRGSGTFLRIPSIPVRERSAARSMLVGVWFNLPRGSLYGPMFDAIRQELSHWSYHAVLEDGLGPGPGDERRGIESLMHKHLDGYIVAPTSNPADDHEILDRLANQPVPLVMIDKRAGSHVTDLVAVNHELGAQALVEYLLGLGHRRIGFAGIQGVWSVQERCRTYRVILERCGIEVDEAWVRLTPQVYADYGQAAAREILSLPPDRRPTAILGANDPIAETIAREARSRGLQVPEDLSIVGFDNTTVDSREGWLTTYAQPKVLIGQCAARLLMSRIGKQKPYPSVERILLEGELLVRGSTGPPRNC
jgi:GntR family transcriptional regulator of arabinose operon